MIFRLRKKTAAAFDDFGIIIGDARRRSVRSPWDSTRDSVPTTTGAYPCRSRQCGARPAKLLGQQDRRWRPSPHGRRPPSRDRTHSRGGRNRRLHTRQPSQQTAFYRSSSSQRSCTSLHFQQAPVLGLELCFARDIRDDAGGLVGPVEPRDRLAVRTAQNADVALDRHAGGRL